MKKLTRFIAVFLYIYAFYIMFTASTTEFSLTLGFIASALLATLSTPFLIQRNLGAHDLKSFAYLLLYYFRYMIIEEYKAHKQVIKIVLSRKLDIKPAIVKVPYSVKTDYGMTLIAGSITNTPGTCVVDVDEKRHLFYVHWIYATTIEPEKAREEISKVFEEYAAKIFG
jgi:multicomponent Na+:H+ antiporter subunit E